ncbi:MAG: hypothetical protein ACJAZB_001521 [Psychrosphaera sp.]|jgi:hypothetical protein
MPAFAGIFLFIPIIFFILNIPRPSLTKKAIYLTSNTLFIIFGLRLTAYGLRLTAYGLRLTAYGLFLETRH